jgi:hypothetical protein
LKKIKPGKTGRGKRRRPGKVGRKNTVEGKGGNDGERHVKVNNRGRVCTFVKTMNAFGCHHLSHEIRNRHVVPPGDLNTKGNMG